MESLSVIITSYNQEDVISDAIHSARKQDDLDVQVIVVDDGSSDESVPAALAAGADLVIERGHEGKNAARQAGLRHVEGNYVKWLDGDDTLVENTAAAHIAAMGEFLYSWGKYIMYIDDGKEVIYPDLIEVQPTIPPERRGPFWVPPPTSQIATYIFSMSSTFPEWNLSRSHHGGFGVQRFVFDFHHYNGKGFPYPVVVSNYNKSTMRRGGEEYARSIAYMEQWEPVPIER